METKLKYAVEGTLLRIELNGDYLEYDDDEVVRRLCLLYTSPSPRD